MIFKERADAVTKVTANFEPLILITRTAIEKMGYYVQHCDKEVGWLGTVEKYGVNYLIREVFLFKQEVHSATCEITPDGLSDFATELLSKPNGVEVWNNIKLWGHSHVNMGISPSAQDNSQMNTFGEHNDWFVRVIANKKGDMEFSLFDFKTNLRFDNVKWIEFRETSPDLEEQIKAEIAEKVTEFKYATTNIGYTRYPGYGAYGYDYEEPVKTKKNVTEGKVIDINKAKATVKWTPTRIAEHFDDRDLKEITTFTEVQDKLLFVYDTIEAFNVDSMYDIEVSFEDAVDIITYAENKYPC
jgi:hypothetical protein